MSKQPRRDVDKWRDFLKEVSVVVLGVIIALAADQYVKSRNDKNDADAALRNIRQEISYNLGFINRRMAVNSCIGRRLDELAAYLDALDAGRRPPAPRFIGHPPYPEFTAYRLDAAQSAGSMSHISPDDQALVAAAYQPLTELKKEFDHEQVAWAELRSLANRPNLSAAEQANIRLALQHARLYYFVTDSDARLAAAAAQRLGVTAGRPAFRTSTAMCLPMSTSFDEASKRNESTFGEVR
jgi:hypothetical protein